MDNMEKLKRHLAKDVPLTFKNSEGVEDTFYFKPLNIEQQATMMEIGRRMEGRPKITIEGVKVPEVNKEDVKEIFDLFVSLVKSSKGSFENIDDKTAEDFVNSNYDQLFENISKLMPVNQGKKNLELIKKAKEENKNAGN